MNPDVTKALRSRSIYFLDRCQMFRSCLLVFLVVFIQLESLAQANPADQFKVTIIPPSPDAATLGKYGEHPVTLNNGLVNISIPLYEIKSGKLSLPISLSYHAAGVKAYDVASSVGLNWSLNAGGTISRTMRGQPDESPSGVLNRVLPSHTDPGEHFTCFLWGLTSLASPFDGQADLFSYSLGGSSGKFVFKNIKDIAAPREIATIPFSPLRIQTNVLMDAYTIIDTDGTTYIFGQVERTTTAGHSSLVPTSWYLTSIISVDKSDTITFTYTEAFPVQSVHASNAFSERVDITADAASRVELSESATVSLHFSINVKEITFNNGKVTFEYEADREDNVARRLNEIRIYNKNSDQYAEIKRFTLQQSYFTATGVQKSQLDGIVFGSELTKRLKLDGVLETGFKNGIPKEKPGYSFEYEEGAFPVYGSTAQDFMGYYNGAHSNENLLFYGLGENDLGVSILSQEYGADREVNPSVIKSGSIKQINYPTGGFTEFELEPNQVSYTSSVTTPVYAYYGDDYVLTNRNPGVVEFPFTMTSAMTGGNNKVTARFTIDAVNNIAGQLPISTTISIYDETTSSFAQMMINPDIFNPQWVDANYAILSTTPTVQLYADVELWRDHSYTFYWDDNVQTTNNFFYSTLTWKVQTSSTTQDITTTKYTGGLRIKSITANDGMGNTQKKMYAYTKWYYNSNLYTGDMTQMAELFKGRSRRIIASPNPTWYWYNSYGENITFQAGSSSGTVASYEEVEEYQVDLSGNPLGKTVDTFNKAIDAIPSYVPDFRSDEEWKRGQLANRKIFKSIGNGEFVLIQEIEHEYDDDVIDAVKSYVATVYEDPTTPGAITQMMNECTMAVAAVAYRWMDFDQTIYKSNLVKTTTTQYDQNGENPIVSVSEFVYGNPTHLQLTQTTQDNNNGNVLTGNLKYPLDYALSNCEVQICETNLNNALATLKTQKLACEQTNYSQFLSSGSASDFGAYLNCQTTFHNQVVQTVMPAYNACNTDYSNCLNTAISSANIRDKSILIMQRDNIVSQVIQNTTGFMSGETEYLTGGVRTDFRPTTAGITVPDMVWGLNTNTPLAKSVVESDPITYYRKIGTFTAYDEQNNIVEKSKDKDVLSSYIWDYNKEYPIAEVFNASANEIAFTSFESNGTGNWSVSGSGRLESFFHNGKRSYSLGTGNISKSGLADGKDYIISFWARNGNVSVNNTQLSPSSVAVNGWQYYQTQISGTATTQSVTISGSVMIDDLRFHPAGATMTAYTFDPLLGVTSASDNNSQTTRYEYDELGRLQLVKDDKGNILKKYRYHYAQE